MTNQTRKLCVLFADISNTSVLGEALGAGPARDLLSRCVTLMSEQVKKYGGELIKAVGDELMCVFEAPDGGLRAALGIRETLAQRLAALNSNAPVELSIRAGLHHGPATRRGDGLAGEASDIAGLMAGTAKAGQILLSAALVRSLSAELRALVRSAGKMAVTGPAGPEMDVFEVAGAQPQAPEAPAPAAGRAAPAANAKAPKSGAATGSKAAAGAKPPPSKGRRPQLRLLYRGREVHVDEKSGPLVLGRGKAANLVIADSRASREHARIEWREGRFVLSDQSRHGTYLLTAQGRARLRGEEAVLDGRGKIALGRETDKAEEIIAFALEA